MHPTTSSTITSTHPLRTSQHELTLPPRATARPIPAARGPARAPTRADAPHVHHVLDAVLALLRLALTLTVVDVLTQWARRGGDWHLVVHPDVMGAWVGVQRPGCVLFFAAINADLRAFSHHHVAVNDVGMVGVLAAPRPPVVGGVRLAFLATVCAAARAGLEYRAEVAAEAIGVEAFDGSWSTLVSIADLTKALDGLATRGVDDGAEVWAYPRTGTNGTELVLDGPGWVAMVECLVEAPESLRVLRLTLPQVEGELRAEAWPDLGLVDVTDVSAVRLVGEVR